MDTKTKLTIRRLEDIVALIPYRLGFRPRDSVVLIGMCGPRNRLGLVSRVDLADVAHPAVGPRLLQDLAGLMEEDGAHDVFVVLYSDLPRPGLAQDPMIRGAMTHLRSLTSWADAPGPWVVGTATFGCWGDAEQCGPATGELSELEQGTVAATMVLHGYSVATDRTDLGVPRSADPARRRAATRAAREARRRRSDIRARCGGRAALPGAASGAPGAVSAVDQVEMVEWREAERQRWVRLVALACRGVELPAAELGRLAAGLEDNAVRDGVLCSLICEPPPQVPDAAQVTRMLDLAMLPGGATPDPSRTDPASEVLRALVACAPRRSGALALGLLAWLAWWCGDGARADVLVQQALHVRPHTRLAQLVDQALAARVPPGWVHDTVDDGARGASVR